MIRLNDKQIEEIYNNIRQYYHDYLQKLGVIIPGLKRNGIYTKEALVLVYLAKGYPDTELVSKEDLTAFIKAYFPNTNDVQQARHLGAQKGWHILSGTRNDNPSANIPHGNYKLQSLETAYPGFTAERRCEHIDGDYWEELKKSYGFKCACCGSEEGKPHRYWTERIVKLQKGHKDPSKSLEKDNIIPQCEPCNSADRNYWVYDDKGRVVGISNEAVIDNCSDTVQKNIYERLYRKFNGQKPESV